MSRSNRNLMIITGIIFLPAVFINLVTLVLTVLSTFFRVPDFAPFSFIITIFIGYLITLFWIARFIHSRSSGPADLGWGGGFTPDFIARQSLTALATLLAMFFINYGIFDPIGDLVRGEAPTWEVNFEITQLSIDRYILMISTIILVPISNTIFRGFPISRLAAHISYPGALLLTSFAYGIMHLNIGWLDSVFAGTVFLVGSLIYLSIGRGYLWGVVVGHIIYNTIHWIA